MSEKCHEETWPISFTFVAKLRGEKMVTGSSIQAGLSCTDDDDAIAKAKALAVQVGLDTPGLTGVTHLVAFDMLRRAAIK
jgi:hypothetical protein